MTAEQTKIAEESHVKAPWLNVYGVVPPHLDYPDCTMYEAVERCAETYPNHTAYVFMGRKTTYRAMAAEIDLCARALKATGVRPGDRDHHGHAQLPSGGDHVLRHQSGGGHGQYDPSPFQREGDRVLLKGIRLHLCCDAGSVLP